MLERSDLLVELMGGIEPTREYLLRAMAAGRHVVTANKQLLSQHGEELWDAARKHGVQLRFEGAVAGVVPVIRVLQESLAGAKIDRVHGIVNGTTNFILTEMARDRHDLRGGARRGAASRLRRGRPDRGRGRHAMRQPRWRSSPGWHSTRRSTSTRSDTRESEHITPDDLEYARELGFGPEADRHRRTDGRRAIGAGASRLPVPAGIRSRRSTGRSTRSRSNREAITEITMSGPGAGGPRPPRAVLGDVGQRHDPAGLDAADDRWSLRDR